MQNKKILGLCGSLRADSWNLKLLKNFLAAAEGSGFSTQLHSPLQLPLMNEDLEKKPLDASILNFRSALQESTIVVLGSPEYNGSLSPVLKNAIDWGTRPPANLWEGKIAVLLAASPGSLGGARGLIHLRTVLSGIKTWVIPEQVQCALADHAFDEMGGLTNEAVKKQIAGSLKSLTAFAEKMLR
ncbi:MAG TPA: NADPH-dependent FMN reductase [Bdellovibrionota bacterium]|jgi:NAD(P)H-dependent FMN reductase